MIIFEKADFFVKNIKIITPFFLSIHYIFKLNTYCS